MSEPGTGNKNGGKSWYVYVIQASDDSLYTGITTDVQRRFKEHSSPGKGAKYFRGKQPVAVVYSEKHADQGSALRREAEIKKLSRGDKLQLIGQGVYICLCDACKSTHVCIPLSIYIGSIHMHI